MPKSTLDTPRAKITRLRDSGKKWREIGDVYPGVKLGTLARIYFDPQYEPHRPELRAALGLPCYAPAPVCTHCGKVPLSKRCPCKRKPSTGPKRVYRDYPVWAMREISELVTAQPEARVIVLGVGFDYENVKVGYKP